jgi:hypothetical protein
MTGLTPKMNSPLQNKLINIKNFEHTLQFISQIKIDNKQLHSLLLIHNRHYGTTLAT